MKKRVASIVLVTGMGLGGVASLGLTPSFAAETATTASQRLTELKSALKGLVSDGTLTQAQADKVATTLDAALPQGGPGGPGGHHGGRGLDEAATVLGMTVDELRTALGTDTSLADVAKAKGISKATLISKLVAAAKAHLATDVKAGRLTQAQADARAAELKTRITDMVDRVGMPTGHGGPGGGGPAPSTSSTATA
ncbi:MAG TPA: hypothetical protein VM097_04600 [Mycobacteriales bacterium]|nr:hypothetical protein [Mycobacteriales bacterium]